MEYRSTARYLMISPRKMRLVADEVRGYNYKEAMDILSIYTKKSALMMSKTIKAAAGENDKSNLYIKKIVVDEGPRLKRFRPRARGRAMSRIKRTSHLTVILSD